MIKTESKVIKYILDDSRHDMASKIQSQWFSDFGLKELFEIIRALLADNDYVSYEQVKTKLNELSRSDLISRVNFISKQDYIFPGDLHIQIAREYTDLHLQELSQHLSHPDSTQQSKISKIIEIQKRLNADTNDRREFDLGELVDGYIDFYEKGEPDEFEKRSIKLRHGVLAEIFGPKIRPFVYGIGARPGFRKTDLLINLLIEFVGQGKNGIFVSFEDSRDTLRNKFLAVKYMIDKNRVNDFNLQEFESTKIKATKIKSKVVVIENQCDISTLRSRVDQLCKIHDIQFMMVDYIQLFRFGRGKKHEEVGLITKEFMDISKVHRMPVMFASQVNERQEGHGGEVSLTLGAFKESGDIEADVRHATLIQGSRGGPEKIMNIAKNTWGPVHMVKVLFHEPSGYLEAVQS